MYFTVETVEGTNVRHEYQFYIRAETGDKHINIVLDHYWRRERESPRHRTWHTKAQWSRKVGPNSHRLQNEVPKPELTHWVKEQAEAAVRKLVKFPWSL